MARVLMVGAGPNHALPEELDAAAVALPEALLEVGRGQASCVVLVDQAASAASVRELRAARDGDAVAVVLLGAAPSADAAALYAAGADLVLPEVIPGLAAAVAALAQRATRERARALSARGLEELLVVHHDLTELLIHDLMNPLAVISANVRWVGEMMEDAGAEEDVVLALTDSAQASSRLILMLGNVLDVGRAEAGRLQLALAEVDVAEFVARRADAREWPARQRGVAILVEPIAPALRAVFDVAVLGRLLEQLLEGSLRYTPRGGRVVVGARARSGGGLELTVGNTGPPVPSERRATLFEKYAHVRSRSDNRLLNLGVGLYFCRLAADAHGGSIQCEELPEFPTLFRVLIPKLEPSPLPTVPT